MNKPHTYYTRNQGYFLSESPRHVLKMWDDKFNDLRRISINQDNWDAVGAARVDTNIWNMAYMYLNHLYKASEAPPPDRITLSHDGEISFEWQLVGGAYYEAVFADMENIYMMLDEEGVITQWEVALPTEDELQTNTFDLMDETRTPTQVWSNVA